MSLITGSKTIAPNTTNTDTRFFEKDYSDCSIAFAAENLLLDSGKNNEVVCAHVSRNCSYQDS